MAKRYHVTTFGCQMNEHDSERMRGMLASLRYEEAASREDALAVDAETGRGGRGQHRQASEQRDHSAEA
jgi:hypothetical protein